jgi:DNA-binding XRE family transcriptional regulator
LRAIEEGSQLRVKLWLVLRQPSQFTLRTATSLHNLVRVLTIRRLHRGLPLKLRSGQFEAPSQAFIKLAGRTRAPRLYVAAQVERITPLARKRNFARYLREARIKRQLSVAEVAEQVGVSTASIYFWENDHVRPRDANLNALCKVLKLPIKATREMAAA